MKLLFLILTSILQNLIKLIFYKKGTWFINKN